MRLGGLYPKAKDGDSNRKNDILQSLAPQLDAVANDLLRHVYGEEGMPWETPFSELEDVSISINA